MMHPPVHDASPIGFEPVEFLDSPGLPAPHSVPNRVVDGVAVPAVGTWTIDPVASRIEFWVRHLGLAKVRGRFADFDGAVEVAEVPEASSVRVDIDAASVDTQLAARDEHLRSADFLDVARYPRLTFRSRSVGRAGPRWTVTGDLAVHGVARPVTLDVEFLGAHTDDDERDRAAFAVTTAIDREDFGLTGSGSLEVGGIVVGRMVTITMHVEAVRP
jgi:polyisoprenoid-binding protein YceI